MDTDNLGASNPESALASHVEISYRPSSYPVRSVYLSVKQCGRCGAVQSREINNEGPMYEHECIARKAYMKKEPRVSDWLLWKILLVTWPIVCPWNPKGRSWFVIIESGTCDETCGEKHQEKIYRRRMGWWGIGWTFLKVYLFPKCYKFTWLKKPKEPTVHK